ncbi:lytic transglycosylase domain-containing protein [Streptomyces sp. BH097]|uniref:lytic transglycosylase domain-containing protein n=1 Tax=unclassified Streptomyces TaxID=2593676 RepID=UPI003BB5C024
MAAVFGRRLRRGVMTAAVAAAAVAALSASQAPGVTTPHGDSGNSAADRSDDTPPDSATGPDYYSDLPPLDSPTDSPKPPPGGDDSGIPATVLDAYKKAAAEIGTTKPGCNLDWQLLAAIGKVESGQARGGDVDKDGNTLHAITGPPLDGNGFAKITDTDGGSYDGDTVHDRAVGPMQFIPSTWEWAGRDGNGDGKKDPNNVYDAALAAGHYLCRADRDLSNATQLNKAILSYNNSTKYLATVLSWLDYYRKHSHSVPDGTGVLPRHPSGGGSGSGASPSPSPTGRDSDRPSSDTTTTKPPSKNPPKTPSGGGSTSPGGDGTTKPPTTSPTPDPTPTQSVTKLADAGTGTLAALQDDTFGERAKVKARNAAGAAVASAKIRFAIVGDTDATFSGGVTSATVTTDGSGVATAPAVRAGKQTGQFKVRATVVGRTVDPVYSTATVTARADKLTRVDAEEMTCEAGGTFAKAVELNATYKGVAAGKVGATATLVKAADDATEADKGPYFKDADGRTIRTVKGLTADAEGHLTVPKLYADDTTGTFLLRVTTTGGATLDVELKVTAASAS